MNEIKTIGELKDIIDRAILQYGEHLPLYYPVLCNQDYQQGFAAGTYEEDEIGIRYLHGEQIVHKPVDLLNDKTIFVID